MQVHGREGQATSIEKNIILILFTLFEMKIRQIQTQLSLHALHSPVLTNQGS